VVERQKIATKRCAKCGYTKPITGNFCMSRGRPVSTCLSCRREAARIYVRTSYARESCRIRYRKRSENMKLRLLAVLGVDRCSCGETHIACLDFHHVTGEKVDSVRHMINTSVPIDLIIAEVRKCIVLCSNCHRKVHYRDRSAVSG